MAGFKMEERMVHNYEDSRKMTREIIQEINAICQDSQVRRLLPKEELDEIRSWTELLESSMDDRLKVVVAGDFKRGKSSLINALIGQETAVVNISPETITINQISYSDEPGAQAVLENGIRLRLYEQELSRKQLEQILKDSPQPIDHLEIYRSNPFLQHITLVDTPGLGDGSGNYEDKVADYLVHADIVIYVVSALSPFSAEEQRFLNAAVIPQNFSKMFVLVNMADALDDVESIERVKREVSKRTAVFNPNASVYAVSALDEFNRKTGGRRPNPELTDYLEEAYQEFEEAFLTDCILQKEMIKAERLEELCRRMTADIRKRIGRIAEVANLDEKKLKELEQHLMEEQLNIGIRIERAKKKIHQEIDEMRMESHVWIREFLERIRKEISNLDDALTGQQLQKYLGFYLADKLKEGTQACFQVHAERLKNSLTEKLHDYSDELIRMDHAGLSDVRIDMTDVSWTGVDNAVFVLTKFITPLSGIGYAIAGFMRQDKIKKSQKDQITPLLENFDELSENVYSQLDDIYREFAQQVGEIVEKNYRRDMESALQDVAHTKQLREEQELETEEVLQCVAFAEEVLERVSGKIR